MIYDKSALAVSGGVSRTGRKPPIQVGKSYAARLALDFVIARVADVLMNDAVGIQVRCVANPPIPTAVMPSKSCGKVCSQSISLLSRSPESESA